MIPKLGRLIAYETILSIAWFFAGSFSLVFLIRKGFEVQHAAYFVSLEYLVTVVLLFIFARRGFPKAHISMALGNLVAAGHFACFLLVPGLALINIAPLLLALYIPLFWIPFNIVLIGLTTARNRGFIISLTFLIFPIVYFIGPLAGGTTIERMGYGVLFSVAFALFLINAALVFVTWRRSTESYSPQLDIRDVRSFSSLGFALEGVQEGVFAVGIPLATFFLVGEEFDLGALLAVFGLAGGAMSVLAGRLSDRSGNRMTFIILATVVCGPLMLVSAFVRDQILFGATIGAIYFFLPLFWILLFALSVDRARSPANAIMTRELMLNVGRTTGAFLCLIASFWVDIQMTFIIAGIALLFVPFVGLLRKPLDMRT